MRLQALPTRPRVLVTRPAERTGELVTALEAVGCEPVVLPLIRAAPPEDAAPLAEAVQRIEDFDWIVFTSAAAVGPFATALAAAGRAPADLGHVRLAAVGPATAEALRQAGCAPDVMPDTFTAAAIVPALGVLAGKRVLWPRADIARPGLPAALRQAGAEVVEVIAYRTVPVTPDEAVLTRVRTTGVDVVTFASPSSVAAFMALGGMRALAEGARVVCIGPATAEAARAAGLAVDAVATQHSASGLAAAVVGVIAGRAERSAGDTA